MARFSDVVNEQNDEAVDVDFGQLAEQYSNVPREPLPQPGRGYTFALPQLSLEDDIWEERQTEKGKRISVTLKLVIAQSPHGSGEGRGQTITWRCSNAENTIGDGKYTSQMAYLIKEGLKGRDLTGAKLSEYAKELVEHSGEWFKADLGYSGKCNEKNQVRGFREVEGRQQLVDLGRNGCGQRYAMKDRVNKRTGEVTKQVPRDASSGRWLDNFICSKCEALVSVFPDLSNFKPADPQPQE